MSHIPLYAEITGYACWIAALWALMTKVALTAERIIRERRRWRNARRLAEWKPPRHTPEPGHDVTRVMPGIQRPKGP